MSRVLICFMMLMAVSGCVHEYYDPDLKDVCVEVGFEVNVCAGTKSGISPDEYGVDDLTMIIYHDGSLYDTGSFGDLSDVSFVLDAGRTYDVYALANVGEVDPALKESDFLSGFSITIDDVSDLDGYVPMASERIEFTVEENMLPVRIELVRLVSKIRFNIENDALDGLNVESVRLCQSALKVFPFNDFNGMGSKVSVVSETADGDYASSADLEVLNTGGAVTFYTLENCQGVLLPDNDDPWMKVPWYLGSKGDLATYIEVGCRFDDGAIYDGTVIYRFYLGKDDCRDFNVVRNSDMLVTLCLTEDGIDRISWKVEADVRISDVPLDYVFCSAEYMFQYSCLEFPSASPEHPVILEVCGNSVPVTGERQEELFNVKDSEGKSIGFFAIVPQAPGKVFFNSWNDDEPLDIVLSRGPVSETLTFTPKQVSLALYAEGETEADVVNVCESGLVSVDAYVYLADAADGRILELEDFFMPVEYAEYIGEDPDYQIREALLCLEDMSGTHYGTTYHSVCLDACGLDEGEDYLQGFRFYGLDAGGKVEQKVLLSLFDDNIFCLPEKNVISLTVRPAFPAQGYLGEYVNYQLAPGNLAADGLKVLLREIAAGGGRVSVGLRRTALSDVSDLPDRSLWDNGQECDAYAEMSSSAIVLHFPAPDTYDYKELPCGSMIAKASVRNPISNRLIEGFYTFDLIMYLSVGLQVDISDNVLYYSFVPFTKWTLPEYSDFWNDSLGGMLQVKARNYYGGGYTESRIQVGVPESADSHQLSYVLPKMFSDTGQDAMFDEIVSCLLPLKNSAFDFSFYTSSSHTADQLEITRNKAPSYLMYEDYADGSKGYYRVVRQKDAKNLIEEYGLENHLVEVAYGSFESY